MKKNPYHQLPGLSSHMLGWVLPEDGGSPEMFTYFLDNPPAELDATFVQVGTALHKFIEVPDKFVSRVIDMPGPKLQSVVDILLEDDTVLSLSMAGAPKLLEAANIIDYQRAWGDPARVNDIVKKGEEYFAAMRMVDDNTALLGATEDKIVQTCMTVLKNKSRRIFAPEFEYPAGTEIFKEVIIEFEISGVKCKALIDRLVINHIGKWFCVEDFKTTKVKLPLFFGYMGGSNLGAEMVTGECYKRQIHRQTAFYNIAAQFRYPGYTCRPPWILAQETEAPFRYEEQEVAADWNELGVARVLDAIRLINNADLMTRGL